MNQTSSSTDSCPRPASSGFDQNQFGNAYPDGIDDHYWTRARNLLVHDFLKSMGIDNTPILEIGCGRGVVVDYLRKQEVDCWGCDLSPATPFSCDAAQHIFMETNALELPPETAQGFRTLLFLDVLEHVDEPAELLATCLNHFSRARQVVITLPARKELWSNFDEYYGHHKRYVLSELPELLTNTGLTVSQCGYWFHSLYFPGIAATFSNRGRSLVHKGPAGAPARLVHRLAARWLFVESKYFPGALPGTSVFLFATRGMNQHGR